MLLQELLHPKINEVLARGGHYSKVLIADSNYPAYHTLGPNAELVSLNLSPGLVSVCQVLAALLTAVPIDAAHTMMYPKSGPYALPADPPVWDSFRQMFADAGNDLQLQSIEQMAFYDAVNSREHILTIQTGDQAIFANLLLTIGVRRSASCGKKPGSRSSRGDQ
ncbi:D-ribose pyranase [Rosistilla carotiformis]|uniref:D-ribose pyranase n=1 Tax=Rosistilla carotiformis TaxID=2528017 RepID=A0A518JW64_9BACT|nr:RbsD/FucU family protein [Rosistilla carotiformis]QDV69779.1 D-ribose pyranase [Rosistilla carotiformis]